MNGTEQQTPPKQRRNKVAEEKARLRAELSQLANRVPELVNAGGIYTTRRWVEANDQAVAVTQGGYARMSRKQLDALVRRMKGEE